MANRQRACDRCGTVYTYKRSTSRYCGSSCRALGPATATVTTLPGTREAPSPARTGTATYDAAHAELTAAGRAETLLGVALLALAARIDNSRAETGSSLATLTKQLEATRAAALADADAAADPVDELRRIRQEKARAAAG
ncbi:hypothetical protein [uncultured Pseudokineococcus sp.]|uniref:hypothetical protein n=1 Tax=uncultured Pseudokineococcus sp. TaxID=1642928 RepID=UPI002637F2A6|nr:hypothetical protein [uncultured Pseudokineococcus sp.]